MNITYKKILTALLFIIAVFISFRLVIEFEAVMIWFSHLFAVLYPFTAGFIIAYLINIPAKGFTKLYASVKPEFIRKRSYMFAILSSYTVIILFVYLTAKVILPSLVSSIMIFASNFQSYVNNAQSFLNRLQDTGYLPFEASLENLISPETIKNFLLSLNINFDDVMKQIQQILGISAVVMNTALAVVVSIYFLAGKQEIIAFIHKLLKALLPEKARMIVIKYANEINYNFYMFIKCQIIDALIIGTTATLVFSLLGVQYSLLLGFMIGLCNIIPYFGSIISSIVAVILIAFSQDFGKAAIAAGVLVVLQQLDGGVIQPRLMGGSLKINPVLIILGITVGGAYFGVIGMIVAIPIVAVIKSIVSEMINNRLEHRKSDEHKNDTSVSSIRIKKDEREGSTKNKNK